MCVDPFRERDKFLSYMQQDSAVVFWQVTVINLGSAILLSPANFELVMWELQLILGSNALRAGTNLIKISKIYYVQIHIILLRKLKEFPPQRW